MEALDKNIWKWCAVLFKAGHELTCKLDNGDIITHTMRRGLAQGCPMSSLFPFTVQRTVSIVENQTRNADPNARRNIYQDDLTFNGNADPLAGGLALLQKKFSLLGLELNKDKSTIWTNPNGLSHNSNLVERTGMKRADAPIIFHLNSNLDDATNNTATSATLPLDSERPFHNETERTELNILLDKRTDFIKKLMTLTESGLPIHIAQALLRDAAGSDANWHMRSMEIPSRVASEMDRVVGQAYQAILAVGDLTVAQTKQLFIHMREGGFGLSSLQSEPAMMASWASCAARVTARIGLGCVDDLSADIPGSRSTLSKLQAIRREAGEDPNNLTILGSTATSQRALALSRVNKTTRDLRDHIGANSRHRVALDSASGRGATGFLQLPVSNTPMVHNSTFQQAAKMRQCRPVCDPGSRCKNRKRDGTECGAALDKEGKHATTCPCGHALSARRNALRDEIANIARRTGLCADIEVLVDHPAIDPESGARMDVRISKPGVQNADELIDVQVTSPFCVEAAGLVGKAATITESKKHTKYRPAVVTPAILETHGRMGTTLKAFLAKIAPEDQQARATWLQGAVRRISCVLQIHNARIIAKCNGSM